MEGWRGFRRTSKPALSGNDCQVCGRTLPTNLQGVCPDGGEASGLLALYACIRGRYAGRARPPIGRYDYAEFLPVAHRHVVFTLPGAIANIAHANKAIATTLFKDPAPSRLFRVPASCPRGPLARLR
jgi:hypothetical protein